MNIHHLQLNVMQSFKGALAQHAELQFTIALHIIKTEKKNTTTTTRICIVYSTMCVVYFQFVHFVSFCKINTSLLSACKRMPCQPTRHSIFFKKKKTSERIYKRTREEKKNKPVVHKTSMRDVFIIIFFFTSFTFYSYLSYSPSSGRHKNNHKKKKK